MRAANIITKKRATIRFQHGNGRDAKRDESPRNYSPYPGGMLDLIKAVPVAVDKHSTGGVGDKTLITAQGRNVRYIDEPSLLSLHSPHY